MSGTVSMPAIPLYLSIIKDEPKAVAAAEAGDVATRNLVAHFATAAPTLATPAKLLSDYRSLQVVLGGFGMSSMIGQTAILRQLMTQDPTSKTSLAATSTNTEWKAFAKAMSGWSATSTPLSSATAVSTIVSNFQTAAFEAAEGKSNPGMQQALAYTRNAGSITSINGLMSNQTLLTVAETVDGLDPDQFGALDFDQQQRILTKDVKLSSFATPTAIQRTAEQYLALTAENPPTTAASTTISSLFTGGSGDSLLGAIARGLGITT